MDAKAMRDFALEAAEEVEQLQLEMEMLREESAEAGIIHASCVSHLSASLEVSALKAQIADAEVRNPLVGLCRIVLCFYGDILGSMLTRTVHVESGLERRSKPPFKMPPQHLQSFT